MHTYHSGVAKERTKTKEISIYQALQQAGFYFECQKYLPFAGCGLNSETRCAYFDYLSTKLGGTSFWKLIKITTRAIILLVTCIATLTSLLPWPSGLPRSWQSSITTLTPSRLPNKRPASPQKTTSNHLCHLFVICPGHLGFDRIFM